MQTLIEYSVDLLLDGAFAAVAAIGFGSISNVPFRAFKGCALLAAVGHATRYALMHFAGIAIIPAAFVATLIIGLLAPRLSHYWNLPSESLAFPALLPMIPGMYAYRSVEALVMCFKSQAEADFLHDYYLFAYNGMICVAIVMLMVFGVTIPIHVQKIK